MTRFGAALVGLLAVCACGDDGDGGPDGTGGGGHAGDAAGAGRAGAAGSSAGGGGTGEGGGTGGSGVGGTAGMGGAAGGVGGGTGGDAGTSSGDAGSGGDGPRPGVGLAADHPNDEGIADDPAVIFHSDFEQGLAGWTRHTDDPDRLDVIDDGALSHAGSRHLRAQVTRTDLAEDQYVSAQAQIDFARRVPTAYIRFYARFVGDSATPHHWVRFAAGTESFQTDGLANTRPAGDDGFWFDLDARRDRRFNFYVYWYRMRYGRCNDGSATPGCAGDQGNTYYYGNNFTPAEQTPFARDAWFCVEVKVSANTVGQSDGALALWKDDVLVGEYEPGEPRGRWLRDNFYTFGQYYEDQQAFEGFDFRSSEDVLLKRFTLDAYYEEGSLNNYAMELPTPEAQIILYDDVVIAEQRIGCMSRP
jgi:hypothetical protein